MGASKNRMGVNFLRVPVSNIGDDVILQAYTTGMSQRAGKVKWRVCLVAL